MRDYPLYLESGPKHRKTMVHVIDLLGCVATGPTTEQALEAIPLAIDQYRRLLKSFGEDIDPREPVTTHIAEHVTRGYGWLGNGDPHIAWPGELEPTSAAELETWVARFLGLRTILGRWAATLDETALEADSCDAASTRTAGAILLHVLGPSAQYLSNVLGPCPGYAAFHRHAERGEMPIPQAMLESAELLAEHIRAATEEQRNIIVQRKQDDRTLRKQMRHLLEHEWEHLAELARRPGGPQI